MLLNLVLSLTSSLMPLALSPKLATNAFGVLIHEGSPVVDVIFAYLVAL